MCELYCLCGRSYMALQLHACYLGHAEYLLVTQEQESCVQLLGHSLCHTKAYPPTEDLCTWIAQLATIDIVLKHFFFYISFV